MGNQDFIDTLRVAARGKISEPQNSLRRPDLFKV